MRHLKKHADLIERERERLVTNQNQMPTVYFLKLLTNLFYQQRLD